MRAGERLARTWAGMAARMLRTMPWLIIVLILLLAAVILALIYIPGSAVARCGDRHRRRRGRAVGAVEADPDPPGLHRRPGGTAALGRGAEHGRGRGDHRPAARRLAGPGRGNRRSSTPTATVLRTVRTVLDGK